MPGPGELRRLLLSALVLCCACPASAQPPAARPRVGVVLSGGSAKGFAHIGVLRVLEDAGVPIDVIAGTSMGALVGGLYAVGYGSDELERIATGQEWSRLFGAVTGVPLVTPAGTRRPAPTLVEFPLQRGRLQLPSALVGGQDVWRLLARLTWPAVLVRDFRQLRTPFAAVATDIETGEAVVFDAGYLPDALRASMSLPGVFRPMPVDGRLLVDGGIVRNLPSAEARALGATVLVCSDVSEPLSRAGELQSFLDVVRQTVSFQMHASTQAQRRLCDVLIVPDVSGLASTAFERAPDWIARGERAARAALPQLAGLGRAPLPPGPRLPGPLGPDEPVHVDDLEVVGVDPGAQTFAERMLALDLPGPVAASELDAALARLQESGAFDRATYRIRESGGRRVLEFRLAERSQDAIGFGFRYDNRYKASLFLGSTLHNRWGYGTTTDLGLRLGEESALRVQHLREGPRPGPLLGLEAGYAETTLDVFVEQQRIARLRLDIAHAAAVAGLPLGRQGLLSVRLKAERAGGGASVAAERVRDSEVYGTLAASVWLSSLDRPVYPHRGVELWFRSEGTPGVGARFWHHLAQARAAVPFGNRLTVLAAAVAGAAGGRELPFHYRFFLGGEAPSAVFAERQPAFPGLRGQERSGRALQLLKIGARYELAEQTFVGVHGYAGNTAEAWQGRFDDYLGGYELALGALTFVGPVEVALTGSEFSDRPRFEFRLGLPF
jgi:NTE family protein